MYRGVYRIFSKEVDSIFRRAEMFLSGSESLWKEKKKISASPLKCFLVPGHNNQEGGGGAE